jgi:hypothetical protein
MNNAAILANFSPGNRLMQRRLARCFRASRLQELGGAAHTRKEPNYFRATRIVTNSSAIVGCTAKVASKSAFVAFI